MRSIPKVESSLDYERSGGWWRKVSREGLGSPSQPFICEDWVPGLFSKPITDKVGLNKP
jgi:hypothetical protein